MEEYDVLGNFKDLNKMFKNIPKTAAALPSSCKFLEDSFDDSDFSEFETPKNTVKTSLKTNKAPKTQTIVAVKPDITSKTEEPAAVNADSTIEEGGIASRTRRKSSRNSIDHQNNSNSESHKSRRGRPKRTNTQTTSTDPNPLNNAATFMNGDTNNAGNSTRGRPRRAKTNNSQAPAVLDTIEIGDVETTSTAILGGGFRRDVMRARRNYIAEHAARCPTVDVVDLVTSPITRTGVINVDEVDESTKKTSVGKQQGLDFSFDEDNPDMSIKINWQFKPQIFQLRKYQKFNSIFEQLAKSENIEVDQVFLNLSNQIIKPDDTPASINYKIYQFIDGRAMDGNFAVQPTKKKRNQDVIKLKIQSDKFKKPLIIELNKTDKFRTLLIKCAEELKMPRQNIIKLCFDGETLEYDQTPVDLELEGGELIEIHLKT